MIDLLAIGSSGVRAYQAALAQTGDNVANADTVGYARRSLKLATGPAGAGTPLSRDTAGGSGVVAGDIVRAGDALKTNAARVASGDHARFAARSDWLGRLQAVVTGSNLDSRIGGFFDAGTDLAAAPTSAAARTIFLDRADQAASAFRDADEKLAGLGKDIATATSSTVDEVNAITSALARVNDELRRTQAGGSAANSLLDNRDSLLAELADRVRISVTEAPRGIVTVQIGAGGAAAILVPGKGDAVRIGVRDGASGAELILDPTHSATAIRLPASGSLSGLIEAGRQVASAAQAVNLLASRFATGVNAWHTLGTDALGDAGTRLFATQSLAVTPGKANAGSASVDLQIADGAVPDPTGYRLLRDASGWTLSRNDGGASVTGPGAMTLDGISVQPGTGARDGDSYALDVRNGAAGITLRPVGPERLAVAARFISDAGAANTGDARLVLDTDVSAAAFAAAPPYTVTITGAGSATIADAAGTVLAALVLDGSRMIGAGFGFTLTGTPATGDSFRILASAAGSSDNGNIRTLARLRDSQGAGGTLESSLDASTAGIASRLAESDRLAASSLAIKDDTARAADAVSGIDLDHEAAELTRLQMAYRANAQVIAAARDLFDAILGIAR